MNVINTNNNIPNEEECLAIMVRCGMFPNIVEHSVQVKNVAEAIAQNLKDDVIVNKPLIIAGALLHDIAKTKSIVEHLLRHDIMGADMLREMGFSEIADICAAHVIMNDFMPEGSLEEREIVHYADKRVKHNLVVSLEERIEDLIDRYGINDEKRKFIQKEKDFIDGLEKKILRFMKVNMETALTGL